MPESIENPARLFVICARGAPQAVILRRGPSHYTRLILWQTDTDTFAPGQWINGRVYQRRCDLSPDGTLLLYFVAKHHLATGAAYGTTWTAISKPPYFTALALWPKGDAWGGGGLFLAERQTKTRRTRTRKPLVWLNHPAHQRTPHPDHVPAGVRLAEETGGCGEDFPIYARRLEELDGWERTNQGERVQFGTYSFDPATWRKVCPVRPDLFIEMKLHGYDPHGYGDPYRFTWDIFTANGAGYPLEGATWADWDQRGRLVFARQGQLFAVEAEACRPGVWWDTIPPEWPGAWPVLEPLADFNDQAFEPIQAPAWACQW